MQDPIYDQEDPKKKVYGKDSDLPAYTKKKSVYGTDDELPVYKKKEGGGAAASAGASVGGPETSPSAYRLPSSLPETPGTFLDRDIEESMRPAVDIGRYGVTPIIPEEVAKTKSAVSKSTEALAAYNKNRIEQLNNQKKQLEARRAEYTSYMPVGDSGEVKLIIDDKAKYKEVNDQIKEIDNYIGRLRNNVAEVSADIAVSGKDVTQLDPVKIGREIVRSSNPHLDDQLKLVEKSGNVIPGILRADIERIGLNAIKKNIENNTQLDDIAKQQAQKMVEDLESDFDDRHSEATAQRAREKIGAYFYKSGKAGFFGKAGHSQKELQEAINNPATGLTESEKRIAKNVVMPIEKRNWGTDVPGGGLFRSFTNAIEQSVTNTNNTIAGWTGVRNDSDRAAEVLNEEVGGSRLRSAGENPRLKAELEFLQTKEKTAGLSKGEKKYKEEIEKYTDIRSTWDGIVDGTGNLTGQVAWMAFGAKGIGATGKLLSAASQGGGVMGGLTTGALGSVLSSSTGGLAISSYLNAYDGYRKAAIDLMPGADKAGDRKAYAMIMSGFEAASERIFNDTKVLSAFTKGVAPSVKDVAQRLISREITQQVAREELQGAVSKNLKEFGKEYLKSTFQEATEEGVVEVADGIVSAVFGGTEFDLAKTGKQAVTTFLTTALHSSLVAGMAAKGAIRERKSENAFMRSAIYNMAEKPAEYINAVEELQIAGGVTKREADDKIKLIRTANEYFSQLPQTKTVAIGNDQEYQKPLDFPEKVSYLIHRLNEGIVGEEIAKLKTAPTPDDVEIKKLEAELKRSSEIRKGIVENRVGVTPDIQEITDDDKKSQELKILATKDAEEDDLIGTRFKPVPVEKKPLALVPGEENIPVEKKDEALSFLKELLDEKILVGPSAIMAEKNPMAFYKMISDQAQNMTEDGTKNKTDNPQAAAREAFGDTLVDTAIDLFPAPAKTAASTRIPDQKLVDEELAGLEKIKKQNEDQNRPMMAEFNQGNIDLLKKSPEEYAQKQIEFHKNEIEKVKADDTWTAVAKEGFIKRREADIARFEAMKGEEVKAPEVKAPEVKAPAAKAKPTADDLASDLDAFLGGTTETKLPTAETKKAPVLTDEKESEFISEARKVSASAKNLIDTAEQRNETKLQAAKSILSNLQPPQGSTANNLYDHIWGRINEKYDSQLKTKTDEKAEETKKAPVLTDVTNGLSEKRDDINNAPVTVEGEKDSQGRWTSDRTFFIPFSIIEAANKNDKRGGQTAKQIADRGGYSTKELDRHLPGWRDMLPVAKGGDVETSKALEEIHNNSVLHGTDGGYQVKKSEKSYETAKDIRQKVAELTKGEIGEVVEFKTTDSNGEGLYHVAVSVWDTKRGAGQGFVAYSVKVEKGSKLSDNQIYSVLRKNLDGVFEQGLVNKEGVISDKVSLKDINKQKYDTQLKTKTDEKTDIAGDQGATENEGGSTSIRTGDQRDNDTKGRGPGRSDQDTEQSDSARRDTERRELADKLFAKKLTVDQGKYNPVEITDPVTGKTMTKDGAPISFANAQKTSEKRYQSLEKLLKCLQR